MMLCETARRDGDGQPGQQHGHQRRQAEVMADLQQRRGDFGTAAARIQDPRADAQQWRGGGAEAREGFFVTVQQQLVLQP